MASFTDAIPQFNPYIQQLPVDAMVSVGMQKQQQYDQGIQRIQSEIDRVAGLDVVRDVDRQYLQSKLNDLGSKLRTVAAGDFSNFQLVNSVAGMAGKVAKDNNVINAVQATAKYRKEQTFMEEARQKGESAIQNEYDFMQQTNRWLNDENVGAGFSGRYRKYIDVDKKWLDVLKSLHSDLLEEDIPYVYNEDGSLNKSQTAEAMQRISKETVSAAKIENALRASLSPDEMEQLNINGRYEFRNINDPEQLAVYSRTRFGSMIADNEKSIKELEGAKALASSDPNKLLKIEEGINSLRQRNEQLTKDMNSEIEMFGNDIEAAKGFIYRRGAIEQFASAHAWEKQKNNLLTNPINAYRLDIAKHQLNLAQFEQDKAKFAWQKTMDIKKFELDQMEAMLKNNGMLPESGSIYLGASTNVLNQQGQLLKEINEYNQQYQSTINDVLNKLGPSVTREQLENAIQLYENGDAKQFENVVPVQFRAAINSALKSKKLAKNNEMYREQILEQVKQSSPIINEYLAKGSEIAADIQPVTIDGITFSAQEVKNFLDKMKRTEEATTYGTTALSYDIKPIAPTSAKEELLMRNRFKIAAQNSKYFDHVEDYQEVLNKAVEDQMMKDNGIFLPQLYPITLSTEQGNRARATMESVTTGVLAKFAEGKIQGMKGGGPTLSQEEVQTALGWFGESDKNVLQYRLVTHGDSQYISVLKGAQDILIPITPDEARLLPIKQDFAQSSAYKSLLATQQKFRGNTNPTGNFSDSYFDRNDMPNVRMNVRADLTQQYGDPNRQFITFRLMTPKGAIPYQYPQSLDATNAMSFIASLTDEDIKQLYLRSDIPSELKQMINQEL